MIKKIVVFTFAWILSSLFTIINSQAVEESELKVIETNGFSVFENLTKEEARQKAIEDALRRAIEEVVGISVTSDTLVSDFNLASDIINAISYGTVVEKEVLEEDVHVEKKEKDKPKLTYYVKLRAKVKKETGKVDPFFTIDTKLNNYLFKNGDPIEISLISTKDCYAYIFNVTSDGYVMRVFPNRYLTDNLIKAGEKFIFPTHGLKKSGIMLKAYNPLRQKVQEKFYVLCFKERLDLLNNFKESFRENYKNTFSFIDDIKKRVIHIPLSARIEKFINYEIMPSEGE